MYKVQSTKNYHDNISNHEQSPHSNLKPITCIHHTSTHILFSHRSTLTIFPLSYLISKDDTLIRAVNL